MKKQHAYYPAALRFRRWSRKAYAAFSSLQRIVTIGSLEHRVVESLQRKNGLQTGFFPILLFGGDEAFLEDPDGTDIFSGRDVVCLDRISFSEAGAIPCVRVAELYARGRKVSVVSGAFRPFLLFRLAL